MTANLLSNCSLGRQTEQLNLQLELEGPKYCAELDKRRLRGLQGWIDSGWPGSYVQAYKSGQPWRKKIQDEKCRYKKKYDQTSPKQRESLIGGTRATR